MKRIGLILLALVIVLGVAMWRWNGSSSPSDLPSTETVPADQMVPADGQEIAPVVNLSIDYGDGTKIDFADISAANPYDALLTVAGQNNIDVQTKQYDFGVMVESIEGKVNSAEQAWIYYVNGESGQVASDKHELKDGDAVLWKYEKPL